MGRYLIYFSAVLILVIGSTWVWSAQWPMSFFDPSYAVLAAKLDMARNLPADSVVILGDSRAKTGFIPEQLGPDIYNLSLDGATSMEISVLAKILLSSAHPPRAVVVSISPYDCAVSRSFWEWVKNRLFDWATLDEIRARSRRLGDPVLHSETDLTFQHLSPLFGPERPGDAEARLTIALWSLHFPSLDFYSLAAGELLGRKKGNTKWYQKMLETRGYQAIEGTSERRELCWETHMQAFTPSPLLDSYLSDTVALFQARKVPVYLIAAPISELSYSSLQPGFATSYASYMKSYETRYPNCQVLGDPLPTVPGDDLGDSDHLNAQGAVVFSDHVAAILKQAGVEK